MNFWKFYDIWEIDIKSFNRLRVRFDRTELEKTSKY
jgi:hypothetical protein